MTYYMCFIQTFIIRCTVSEILAEIDHKCPNRTFVTLQMTFKLIPCLSYFMTFYDSIGFTTNKLHDAINLGSTSLPLNNINNDGKMG